MCVITIKLLNIKNAVSPSFIITTLNAPYTTLYITNGQNNKQEKIIPQEDHGSPTQNVSQHDNQIDEQIL